MAYTKEQGFRVVPNQISVTNPPFYPTKKTTTKIGELEKLEVVFDLFRSLCLFFLFNSFDLLILLYYFDSNLEVLGLFEIGFTKPLATFFSSMSFCILYSNYFSFPILMVILTPNLGQSRKCVFFL